jgi:hypothetical protein
MALLFRQKEYITKLLNDSFIGLTVLVLFFPWVTYLSQENQAFFFVICSLILTCSIPM